MRHRTHPLAPIQRSAGVVERSFLAESPPRRGRTSCWTGRVLTDNGQQLVRVYHYIPFICRLLCQLGCFCAWIRRTERRCSSDSRNRVIDKTGLPVAGGVIARRTPFKCIQMRALKVLILKLHICTQNCNNKLLYYIYIKLKKQVTLLIHTQCVAPFLIMDMYNVITQHK